MRILKILCSLGIIKRTHRLMRCTVDAVMWCNMCIRIKTKGKTMNLLFSFEKYLYLKYFQKYFNTFTNEYIWPPCLVRVLFIVQSKSSMGYDNGRQHKNHDHLMNPTTVWSIDSALGLLSIHEVQQKLKMVRDVIHEWLHLTKGHIAGFPLTAQQQRVTFLHWLQNWFTFRHVYYRITLYLTEMKQMEHCGSFQR